MGGAPRRLNVLGAHHRSSSRTPSVVRQPVRRALSRMSSPMEGGTPAEAPPPPPLPHMSPVPAGGGRAEEAARGLEAAGRPAEEGPPAWGAAREEESEEKTAERTAGSADARHEHTWVASHG